MTDFNRDGSIIGQNAGSTAAVLMGVLYPSGYDGGVEDFIEVFTTVREGVFAGSLALAQADRLVDAGFDIKSVEKSAPSGGSKFPPKKPSGGGGGAGRKDPGTFELNFGKFRGKTIADTAESGKDGISWLNWYAEQGENEFLNKVINEFLDDNSEYREAA